MGKRRTKKPKNNQPSYVGSGWSMEFLEEQRKEKSCTSKNIYYSENEAEQAALFIRAQYQEKVYPYECRYCNNWHIGHKFID